MKDNAQDQMEKTDTFNGAAYRRGSAGGLSDARWDGELRAYAQASALAARVAVPGGVDAAVRDDGRGVISCVYGLRGPGEKAQGAHGLRGAARGELSVDADIFRAGGLSRGVRVARRAVAADIADSGDVRLYLEERGKAHAAVSHLGRLCRISQSRSVSAELKNMLREGRRPPLLCSGTKFFLYRGKLFSAFELYIT